MQEPLESFETFNEFFYRKLKPGARKLSSEDPKVAVSPADCRMVAFPSVADATSIWVKGKNFSLEELLKNQDLANYYKGGSMAIFRFFFSFFPLPFSSFLFPFSFFLFPFSFFLFPFSFLFFLIIDKIGLPHKITIVSIRLWMEL